MKKAKIETPEVISGGMVSIARELVREEWPRLKKDLTFRVSSGAEFGGSDNAQPIIVPCWAENGDRVEVPRYFFQQAVEQKLILNQPYTYESRTRQGTPIDVRFTGILKREPLRDQIAASLALQKTLGGILALRTGFGKSVVAIDAACKMKRRTLVVVPTTPLLSQWVEKIKEFTNCREVGIVQGPKCDYDKPFVVAMVHSLYQHPYPQGLYLSTGVTIWDESHRMSAPAFMQAVPKFPAAVRWGLSATVKRKDGLHKAFEYHIGPIVYEMLEQELRATVYAFRTGIDLNKHVYHNVWNQKQNQAKLYNALAALEPRNRIIAQELLKAYRADRKILVLSRRTEQFTALMQMLVDSGVPLADMGVIVGEGRVTDDVAHKRRDILSTRRIIFATESIAGTGLDEPSLNTLCYALPTQSVEQTSGRITREYDGKEDLYPLVMDFVDNVPMLQSMFNKRRRIYARLGFPIKFAAH